MIYHFKSLVLVRKGRSFYETLYQEVFFGKTRGGRALTSKGVEWRTYFDEMGVIK